MSVFLFSFNAIAPMLITTLLGWFIRWRGQITERDLDFLNRLSFRYLLAFHIFNSTLGINYHAEFNLKLVLFFIFGALGTMAAAWIIFSFTVKDRGRRCVYIISAYRSSNIIFALPLAVNMFGESGIKPAAMLVPVTIIVFNFTTVAAMVYHAQQDTSQMKQALKRTVLEVIRNPLIIGSLLGILMSLLEVPIPHLIKSSINAIAATATPITMIMLGAQIDLKQLGHNFKAALGACLLRLVLVPAILVFIMILAGFRGPELGALMVVFAAPSAITNLVMARSYNIDPEFTAETVYLSTILSMVTMFIAISLLRGLGFF